MGPLTWGRQATVTASVTPRVTVAATPVQTWREAPRNRSPKTPRLLLTITNEWLVAYSSSFSAARARFASTAARNSPRAVMSRITSSAAPLPHGFSAAMT